MSGAAMPRNAPSGVASPCVDVCRMDAAGVLCLGCQRTLDEIAAWSKLDDAAKLEVWARVTVRRREGESR